MSAELLLVTGGARSGKSRHGARWLAERAGEGPAAVIVTLTDRGDDPELSERIAAHRRARPAAWRTVEATDGEPPWLAAAFEAVPPGVPVLMDCLAGAVSNLVLAHESLGPTALEELVAVEVERFLERAAAHGSPMIVVSNEVGMGVIPASPLGRRFRDALGRANQRVAAAAERVELMVAGLPMTLKG